MPGRTITILFMIVWIAITITFDIVMEWRYGNDATISKVIYDWSHWDPIVAFALGVLCGHFFWSQR